MKAAFGALMLLASLWFGSWAMEATKNTWMHFPSFMTTMFASLYGLFYTAKHFKP